ncbi:DUF2284 domain-containing protein [Acetobacterium bakii]|uniref:Metal-binding protein n=1 Tax=Acetobacterium bakii TaxID=52689 RepID=A0A0L6U040_9FIRM|nr:DUF2284 domain-containing protein [Acetobacterium bakii]KNZ41871.1 metal-binding protein [Acetobacterium bakii]
MTRENIEKKIMEYPIFEYAFFDPSELNFHPAVRSICKSECPQYGKSWSCPPGVGTLEECKTRCTAYDHAFIFSTISEVTDILNMDEMLLTRGEHIEIVNQIKENVFSGNKDILILTAESCAICDTCTYPAAACRHLDKMYPCVESHTISVTDICEKQNMSFLNGNNVITWFGMIFF